MTEEEYFRKNFPDSCYGDKPLSPHWDYFQYGVEFGEQESEKQIKELEQKLEQTEKDLADYQFNYPTIKELEAEVKEWKDKADLWCKTANLKDHNIMINKELEKENAELRNNGFTVSAMTEQQLKVALEKGEQLEKENAELKEKVNILDNCDRLGDVITEAYKDQLTKAKELLKEFVQHYKAKTIYIENMKDLLEQAKQFLSEVEK